MKYDVTVSRTGFGQRTITIEADDRKTAEDKALETASTVEFSEHTSEYHVEGVKDSEAYDPADDPV